MARFSREYRDELEKNMRRDVFKKNLKFIENFNKKETRDPLKSQAPFLPSFDLHSQILSLSLSSLFVFSQVL
jgi:hypothetical protein